MGRSPAGRICRTSGQVLTLLAGSDHETLLGPEGAPVYSMATLRILASMPSRTIGEWEPFPSDPGPGWGFRLKIYRSQSWAPLAHLTLCTAWRPSPAPGSLARF